jgi:hypothetical protein
MPSNWRFFADDVKWFTMGQQCLAMFYMQQHLNPKKKAEALLMYAFSNAVIKNNGVKQRFYHVPLNLGANEFDL